MKTKNSLSVMVIDLYVRCFIIVWVIYLTAIYTDLYNNIFIKFLTFFAFMVWIVLFPVIRFLENKQKIEGKK